MALAPKMSGRPDCFRLQESAFALLAACIAGKAGVAAATTTLAQIAEQQPVEQLTLSGLMPGRSAASGRDDRSSFLAILEDEIEPTLRQFVLQRAPRFDGTVPPSGGGPNVIDAGQLYRQVVELCTRQASSPSVQAGRDELGRTLLGRVTTFRDQINARLSGPDHPDIGEIARLLVRLEAMRWVLDSSGLDKEGIATATIWRNIARRSLRATTEVIDRFLSIGDLESRFGTAGVMVHQDGLIVLIELLMDTARLGERTEGAAEDAQTVDRFRGRIAELAQVMLTELKRGVGGGEVPLGEFRAKLGQADRAMFLERLCTGGGGFGAEGHRGRAMLLDLAQVVRLKRDARATELAGLTDAVVRRFGWQG